MRVEHNYYVIDKVMLNDHAAYKYETPYKGVFVIKKVLDQWQGHIKV